MWDRQPRVLAGRTLNGSISTLVLAISLATVGISCTQDTEPATDSSAAASDQDSEAHGTDSNRVLRHAVFFKFKDSSSAESIDQVVDAFRALPAKIPEISDFAWGTNNSPEDLDDGFTHCFLLTFADEAARAAYLPHPEHKAFGDVLRPHMDKVFVLDYWGVAAESAPNRPLHHAVFFKFRSDAAQEAVRTVEEGFAQLPHQIDAIKAFEWGKNNSPESHDAGFTHCFLVTFDSEEGRAKYLPHPAHKEFVKLLAPVEKVRVLDFWAQDTPPPATPSQRPS